jgi:arginyl-tRNA synthetase
LGRVYATGAAAYEDSEEAKGAIQALNKQVYSRENETLNHLYDIGKAWSLAYFETAYKALGFTPFEKNYMEGDVADEGLELVRSHIADGVFVESNGAIIFKGEEHGLHSRVFINAQGLPTYEAKDLGNAMQKWRDYKYDQSIIITAEEQTQYFRVMLKALAQFAPEQAGATTHIAHGMVRLSSGKMSSRTGKVLRALDVLSTVREAAAEISKDNVETSALAALKYAFLKNRIGGDIAFDIKESVSLQGNSGPYLQYAHARARSILAKVDKTDLNFELQDFESGERSLARKLGEYAETIDRAVMDLMPHHICTYLYELSQAFNSFYEHNRVLGDDRQDVRLSLVKKYADTLKNGLGLLNISAPERM